jgi:ribosomal protein S18 acetylase RimI-like enzyme
MRSPSPALERITPGNASVFKTIRLKALRDSPSAFGGTYARESELSVGYLAMDSGSGCGIVAAFLDERDPLTAHLISMWVAPTHRRAGVGRSLIDAIDAWARGRGAHALRLMVTSSNHSAIEFYKRNGFSMTGNTKPYPNDPALIEYEMSRPVLAL